MDVRLNDGMGDVDKVTGAIMAKVKAAQYVIDFRSEFGKKLRKQRKKSGLTQKDIAKWLNVTTNSYYYYEIGRNLPSLEKVVPLCKILGITPNELFGFEVASDRSYFYGNAGLEKIKRIQELYKRYDIKAAIGVLVELAEICIK